MLIHIQDDILRLQGMGLLEPLLADRTTGRNILWATDAYLEYGNRFARNAPITAALITGEYAGLIRTRARKAFEQQSQRTKARAEVFTPLWVVAKMNDYLDEVWFQRKDGMHKTDEQGRIAFNTKKTWQQYVENRRLEITCGEGPFLVSRYDAATGEVIPPEKRVGLLDRKLRAVSENTDTAADWLHWAVKALRATYGYEFQGDSLLISRINVIMSVWEAFEARWGQAPTASQLRKAVETVTWNLWQMDGLTDRVPYARENLQLSLFDLLPDAKPPLPPYCRIKNWRQQRTNQFRSMKGERTRMKFDFVIGNPPYQEEVANPGDRANPLYDKFMDSAFDIADCVELIHPARFLFDAGQTPKAWNKKMLSDSHYKVLYYTPNASTFFPNTTIVGGIAITLRNSAALFGEIGFFTPFLELNQIKQKVDSQSAVSIDTIVSARGNYRMTEKFFSDFDNVSGRLGTGTGNMLVSNIFDKIPEAFSTGPLDGNDYAKVLGRSGNNRITKYLNRKYIISNDFLDSYNVLISEADGAAGRIGVPIPARIIGKPEIAKAGECGTDTFISIGKLATEVEAINLSKYIQTRFVRSLVGIKKATQHNPRSVWQYVPLQDFTPNSDIDWTQSIADIDRQLYAKYGLDEKEIEFIETHVKEMA